jgi:hypothetical protein
MGFGFDESIKWTLSQIGTTINYNTFRFLFQFARLAWTISASLFCIQLSDCVFTLIGCSLRTVLSSQLLALQTQSQSQITTDGQWVSKSWCRPSSGIYRPTTESSVRCYCPWSDGLEDTFSKGSVLRFWCNGIQLTSPVRVVSGTCSHSRTTPRFHL